jgi:hypothetical protein
MNDSSQPRHFFENLQSCVKLRPRYRASELVCRTSSRRGVPKARAPQGKHPAGIKCLGGLAKQQAQFGHWSLPTIRTTELLEAISKFHRDQDAIYRSSIVISLSMHAAWKLQTCKRHFLNNMLDFCFGASVRGSSMISVLSAHPISRCSVRSVRRRGKRSGPLV